MSEYKPKPAHLIAELVCRRYFATQGYKSLPDKFWNDIRFTRHYKLQMMKAYSLLKIYSGEAILNALKSKQGNSIYSLQAAWLDPIIATEQAKINKLNSQLEEASKKQVVEPVKIENEQPRPTFQTKESLLDKLD